MCPKHGEDKQTLEFGAEEGLLHGPSKENGWLLLKRPEVPNGFQGRVLKGIFWGNDFRVYDFLPIGWW